MADTPVRKDYFPRVREAREALRAKAEEIIQFYMKNAMDANVAGDFETANKALQWLLEHMPADDEGMKVIDQSVDKPKEQSKLSGPSIQIGFALGGVNTPPALPSVKVIDVNPDDHSTE